MLWTTKTTNISLYIHTNVRTHEPPFHHLSLSHTHTHAHNVGRMYKNSNNALELSSLRTKSKSFLVVTYICYTASRLKLHHLLWNFFSFSFSFMIYYITVTTIYLNMNVTKSWSQESRLFGVSVCLRVCLWICFTWIYVRAYIYTHTYILLPLKKSLEAGVVIMWKLLWVRVF